MQIGDWSDWSAWPSKKRVAPPAAGPPVAVLVRSPTPEVVRNRTLTWQKAVWGACQFPKLGKSLENPWNTGNFQDSAAHHLFAGFSSSVASKRWCKKTESRNSSRWLIPSSPQTGSKPSRKTNAEQLPVQIDQHLGMGQKFKTQGATEFWWILAFLVLNNSIKWQSYVWV